MSAEVFESRIQTALANPDAAEFELDRLDAEGSLAEFARQAWPVLEPGRPLKWGWSLDAMCEHLEAVTYGDITRLLINVPPGMMKSLLTRVFWPAWEWTHRPDLRYIGSSYAGTLAVRDNRKARTLVTSDWYQRRWGHVVQMNDLTGRTRFENTSLGWMLATSVGGVGTGERGDRFIVDDPNNVQKAESEAVRRETNHWMGEVVPTRVNDQDLSAFIVIMQRVHEDDVSGFLLAQDLGYEHLMLPMEFEPERRCVTSIGFRDPREEEGELLFPERFSADAVEKLKQQFRGYGGSYAEAGQLQQRPEPREGGMFKVENFRKIKAIPHKRKIVASVRYWDKAGSETRGAAYTVGTLVHLLDGNSVVVADVVRGRWSTGDREEVIQNVAEKDGTEVQIWMEQEPGSGGKDSIRYSIKGLIGYTVRADRVGKSDGDKIARAEPYAAQVEIGNVYVIEAEWNHEFMEEHRKFPAGKFKDQVDSAGGAVRKLVLRKAPEEDAAPVGEKQDSLAI